MGRRANLGDRVGLPRLTARVLSIAVLSALEVTLTVILRIPRASSASVLPGLALSYDPLTLTLGTGIGAFDD